jgi:glycosyltransferase involved in cell wall biosynthesis
MNILLIHQFFLERDDPGGSRFNEMTKVWVREGHTVTVLAGMVNYVTGKAPSKYKGLKYQKEEYETGLTVLRCFVSLEYNADFGGRLWAYVSFVWFGFFGVVLKLRRQKFDVIIATSPPLFIGLLAWMVSRIRAIPYVFEVRDLWPESAIETGVLKNRLIIRLSFWLEKFIYDNALLINVLTPAFRLKLIESKGVEDERIVFIPNAADFSLSEELVKSFNSATFRKDLNWEDKFVVLYVGAHGVANDLIQILNAAQHIHDKEVLFVLIGDGMKKQELVSIARERRLLNIQFIGAVSKAEVFKYILSADVGLSILKKVETFKTIYSNKTFDYMACKKPVLMSIDGVSRALVEKANCGLYSEPENTLDLISKIDLLKQDPANCAAMGNNGFNYVKANFDRSVLAKQYLEEVKKGLKSV